MTQIKAVVRLVLGERLFELLLGVYRISRNKILCNFCGAVFPRSEPNHPEFLACPHCGKIARERAGIFCLLHIPQASRGQPTYLLEGAPGLKTMRLLECSPRVGGPARRIFESNLGEYITSDYELSLHQGQIHLDLTNSEEVVPLRSSYDIILCAHVLEHIPDYRLALRNLYELLAPGGVLILQVPVLEEAYTPVTWDEFHGDNTRVYHRFGFDLIQELDIVFERVEVMVGQLDFEITSTEISPQKYNFLRQRRERCFQAGQYLSKYLGLGNPDLCDAFIATKNPA